jgi:mono/diheme cytochrome c family protein
MLRWIIPIAILLATLAAVPLALIAKARVSTSTSGKLHGWQDMDNQWRLEAQGESELFADGRAMRPPVPGTVARGEAFLETHFWQGRVADNTGALVWAKTFPAEIPTVNGPLPFTVDRALLERGKERYEIFCSMCHGYSGQGDGMVHKRVQQRIQANKPGFSTWAAPASYHSDALKNQTVGELFNTISNGKANMAGYRAQIPAKDRWAIVAYVRALQHCKPAKAEE